jgi:hypothetical protein
VSHDALVERLRKNGNTCKMSSTVRVGRGIAPMSRVLLGEDCLLAADAIEALAASEARVKEIESRWERAGLAEGQHIGSKVAHAAMRAAGWPSNLNLSHPQWRVFCDGAATAIGEIVAHAVKVGRQQGAEKAEARECAHRAALEELGYTGSLPEGVYDRLNARVERLREALEKADRLVSAITASEFTASTDELWSETVRRAIRLLPGLRAALAETDVTP